MYKNYRLSIIFNKKFMNIFIIVFEKYLTLYKNYFDRKWDVKSVYSWVIINHLLKIYTISSKTLSEDKEFWLKIFKIKYYKIIIDYFLYNI